MNIRKAQTEDLISILELFNQINQEHYENVPTLFVKPETTKGSQEYLIEQINNESGIFYVAEADDNIIGLATARITKNTEIPYCTNHSICKLSTIVVDKNCQNMGVGNALLIAVELWAKMNDAKEMRLEVMQFNKSAQEFYRNREFSALSRIMSKPIA